MDVFVIPVAADRYELYCEQPVAEDVEFEADRTGIIGKLRYRFTRMVRAVEERHRTGAHVEPSPEGLIGRFQDRAMAWVAERIAEQRLLWNLRGQTAVVAAYPNDMTFDQVQVLIRQTLQHDYQRHFRWTVIDGFLFFVTFVALGPLFLLIPGIANLPAIYFGFRAIGHFLSMRGAAHALRRVTWSGRECPPLTELRAIAGLEQNEREAELHDIATRLRLEHLPRFFDRVAISQS